MQKILKINYRRAVFFQASLEACMGANDRVTGGIEGLSYLMGYRHHTWGYKSSYVIHKSNG
jgi:hypothetical protein